MTSLHVFRTNQSVVIETTGHEIDMSFSHTSNSNRRFGVHDCVMSLYDFRTNQSVVKETTGHEIDMRFSHLSDSDRRFGVHDCVMSMYDFRKSISCHRFHEGVRSVHDFRAHHQRSLAKGGAVV